VEGLARRLGAHRLGEQGFLDNSELSWGLSQQQNDECHEGKQSNHYACRGEMVPGYFFFSPDRYSPRNSFLKFI